MKVLTDNLKIVAVLLLFVSLVFTSTLFVAAFRYDKVDDFLKIDTFFFAKVLFAIVIPCFTSLACAVLSWALYPTIKKE